MRVVVIGTGYVGLVSGVCFSDFGHEVICIDKDKSKIDALRQGVIPIFEPGLDILLRKNVDAGRLTFQQDLEDGLQGADAVFIAVGTPTRRGDGHADLSYVYAAAEEIAVHLPQGAVVVTKSTVPVGTNREVARRIHAKKPDLAFDIASNPEFLREGAAIEDFMRPDRVVVGVESDHAKEVMSELYRPLFLRETPIVFTSLETAEVIKYAANAFLATKITFINEIADLCENVGADVKQVARGIGLDGRIGSKFLHPGPGYGGSCFPKDTLALAKTARQAGSPIRLVETVIEINDTRKKAMADKIVQACGNNVKDKKIVILGVTFKPNTDDMRDAPSLVIVPQLQKNGANIVLHDPEGRKEGEKLLTGATWADDVYEAVKNADALVLLTEWNQYRALDLGRIQGDMKGATFVDLRNVYEPADVEQVGLHYTGIGRGTIKPSATN